MSQITPGMWSSGSSESKSDGGVSNPEDIPLIWVIFLDAITERRRKLARARPSLVWLHFFATTWQATRARRTYLCCTSMGRGVYLFGIFKVGFMYVFSRLPQIFRKSTVALPGQNGHRYLHGELCAFSSRDNFQLGHLDGVESCPGMSFIPGSSCKHLYAYMYEPSWTQPGMSFIPGLSCKHLYAYVYKPSWTQPGMSFSPGWNPPCTLLHSFGMRTCTGQHSRLPDMHALVCMTHVRSVWEMILRSTKTDNVTPNLCCTKAHLHRLLERGSPFLISLN